MERIRRIRPMKAVLAGYELPLFDQPRRNAVPARRSWQRLALHGQRQRVEFRGRFEDRIVQHHGTRTNRAISSDGHGGHFHDAILEQVRLQRRLPGDRGVVADAHQIELAQIRRIEIHTAANVRAEQPQPAP